jgi:uncharacterized protein YkwD
MTRLAALGLAAALPLLSACVMVVPIPLPGPAPGGVARAATPDPAPMALDDFGRALNAARTAGGLAPLRPDSRLAAAAAGQAAFLASGAALSHRGAGGSGPASRAQAAGCGTPYVGENIARGQRSAAEAFQGWMASPGHRANILRPGFGAYGLGRSGDAWVLLLADAC